MIFTLRYIMPKPLEASDEIYKFMKECWQQNPDDRPSFEHLEEKLEAELTSMDDYLFMQEGASFKIDPYYPVPSCINYGYSTPRSNVRRKTVVDEILEEVRCLLEEFNF